MARTKTQSHSALRDFLHSEAAGGVLLMVAAALAMIVANSAWGEMYSSLVNLKVGPVLELGALEKKFTIHLWINDGLMAIFFFLVGLEIKREFVDGRLSTWEKRRLPFIAAVAGMAVPAIVFLGITSGNPTFTNGWAIPAATDIAFAIGVLALLGKRAPTSLKLFLVTVAIVDDMGAVAIIALVYTEGLQTVWLAASAGALAIMYILNKSGIRSIPVYVIISVILWYFVLRSGVHATVAGVLAAFMIPIIKTPGAPDAKNSPLHIMEHAIHPWSAYLIIPIFGFANAGVNLGGLGMDEIFSPLPLGIAAGLFFGKQLGIFAAVYAAVKFGFATKLRGATWVQIYGVSMLCGIGFTMSLFISELAFVGTSDYMVLLREEAKIGILMGSIGSAVIGFLLLRFAPLHKDHDAVEAAEAQEIERDGDVVSTQEAAKS